MIGTIYFHGHYNSNKYIIKVVIVILQCPNGSIYYKVCPGDSLFLIALRFNTSTDEILADNPGIDPGNLYIGQVICLQPNTLNLPPCITQVSEDISKAQVNLSNYIRMLWEQHITWTRLTILSLVFGLPDVDLVTNRLLQNPKDFEALLKPLYGDKTASRFEELFTNHLVIAAELVKAAKAGNNKAAEDAEKKWYANAEEIAAFLADINPYWSQEMWRTMLFEHLALTKDEAVDVLTGKYSEGISAYDQIETQALEMADLMTDGIVNQFSVNFSWFN